MNLPSSYHNRISYIGSIIAGINVLLIFFSFIIIFFTEAGGTYIGLYIYIALPSFLVFGLLLIPIGMMIKFREKKLAGKNNGLRHLVVDFNNSSSRNALGIFLIGTAIFLVLTSIGSYKAFHYTESIEFCGKVCHSVMSPEFITYQNLSHANVKCVECHIGSGADWYSQIKAIRSVSGLFGTFLKIYKTYSNSNLAP